MLSIIWWKLGLTKIKPTIRVATPLYIAGQNGHLDVVRHLVEVGAGIAAQNGHLDVVRHLVEAGADKDKADNQGTTPLYVAAQNGHLDVVHHLVEVGADKDQAKNQVEIGAQNFCGRWT